MICHLSALAIASVIIGRDGKICFLLKQNKGVIEISISKVFFLHTLVNKGWFIVTRLGDEEVS